MSFYVNNRHLRLVKTLSSASRSRFKTVESKGRMMSTIDQSEVALHSTLSDQWWNEDGPLKVLHAFNKIRVQFIRTGLINSSLLNEAGTYHDTLYLKGLTIADVGCGGGILSLSLARLGCKVVGLEPSKELVQVAKAAADRMKPLGDTEFLATSVEDFAQGQPNSFDAVVCSEVVEHVTQKDQFIEACVKIVKPGGSIFFTTPNRTILGSLITIYGAEYLLRLLPVGTHHYEKFITPDELSQKLSNFCCDTSMINGLVYSPLSNSFSWVPCTTIHYALHAVKQQ